MLVKDVTSIDTEKLTAGQASRDTGGKIWFVMIKDAKGRFPENDLWGDGWGWVLYEAKDPKRNAATSFETNCRALWGRRQFSRGGRLQVAQHLRGQATSRRTAGAASAPTIPC